MAEYQLLTSPDTVATLVERSQERPVLIFKHSLTCPVSGAAFREFRTFLEGRPDDDPASYSLIEIQNARPVSAEVESATGVKHESPQAILLRDGEVAWHASHWKIKQSSLRDALGG